MNKADATVIAGAIDAIGRPAFGPRLDRIMASICAFDMSCIFAFSARSRPVTLHDGYSRSVPKDSIANYTNGGYLLDPFFVACTGAHAAGLWRMSDLAPDCFYSSSFLISPEIHPCVSSEEGSLVEEIGFLIPLEDATTATYSLMRLSGGVSFDATEMSALRALESLVSSLVVAHWQAIRPKGAVTGLEPDMEQVFELAFKGRLTPMQQEVAKLILRGHSMISIATHLSITEGTAKLHRSNLYRRLGISSQAELFQMFIRHILAADVA